MSRRAALAKLGVVAIALTVPNVMTLRAAEAAEKKGAEKKDALK